MALLPSSVQLHRCLGVPCPCPVLRLVFIRLCHPVWRGRCGVASSPGGVMTPRNTPGVQCGVEASRVFLGCRRGCLVTLYAPLFDERPISVKSFSCEKSFRRISGELRHDVLNRTTEHRAVLSNLCGEPELLILHTSHMAFLIHCRA